MLRISIIIELLLLGYFVMPPYWTFQAKQSTESASLKNSYDEYNARYFDNKLSHEVRITYGVLPKDFMGLTEHDQWGYHIGISKQYNPSPRQAKITLLHESCHIANAASSQVDDHGPDWVACMHMLADAGAFDQLW